MKQKLFTLFLALLASVGTIFAWDYQRVQIGDLYYNLDATNQTAEVTSQISSYPFFWSTTITTAIIPASVEYNSVTYSVTSIGSRAFFGCSGLTSVTIPNSVTSIGEEAFAHCTGLTFVTIPNSVTSIGYEAFRDCSGLTSVTIPNSVTSIGNNAFRDCTSLTSVTIPNSVTSIGGYAFQGCTGLTSVTIPNSVTSIGDGAFRGCSGLTSVTIPNSVTSIGSLAFYECTGLTSVTIPNSVTSIGQGAFSWCTGLTSVTIPGSVTSIGEGVFVCCTGLTSIDVASDNSNYCSEDGVLFNKDKTTLIRYPGGKQGSYTIPNSVTSIGWSAFAYCTGLTSVTIPNSVTSIGYGAFSWCTGLTSVTIPGSVTSIGEGAFYKCSGLTSVTIPNSVTSIGAGAFDGCSKLVAIYATCGDIDRLKQLLDNDSRVKYEPIPYSLVIIPTRDGTIVTNYDSLTICDEPNVICTVTPKYGYHFTQWSDGSTDNPRTIVLTQDTTLSAVFAINTYLVQFFGFDNVLLDSQSIEHGTAAVAPEAPTVDHFDFVGWDKEFTNITSDLDVYAIYQKNTEDVENVGIDALPHKIINDGQIFIIRGDKTYTLQGQEVK